MTTDYQHRSEKHGRGLRLVAAGLAAALLLVACGGSGGPPPDVDPLPPITVDQFKAMLGSSQQPLLVNIWASWCVPCRSEAPLLRRAHQRYGDRVRFIGIDVQDTQAEAQAFIAEFSIPYENYFDPPGAIPAELNGFGVPLTYFFAPGGELVYAHIGIIDERTLALRLDELLSRS